MDFLVTLLAAVAAVGFGVLAMASGLLLGGRAMRKSCSGTGASCDGSGRCGQCDSAPAKPQGDPDGNRDCCTLPGRR